MYISSDFRQIIIFFYSDGFAYHNGAAFSTYDQDHDTYPGSCASAGSALVTYSPGPNWFYSCWQQFLMGQELGWRKSFIFYRVGPSPPLLRTPNQCCRASLFFTGSSFFCCWIQLQLQKKSCPSTIFIKVLTTPHPPYYKKFIYL